MVLVVLLLAVLAFAVAVLCVWVGSQLTDTDRQLDRVDRAGRAT